MRRALLLLALCGCDHRPAPAPSAAPPAESVRMYNGAVTGLVLPASQHPSRPGWTPDDATIGQFEAGLADYLKAQPPREAPDLYQQQATYHRQYLGITDHGARVLEVHFFCASFEQWDHPGIGVDDGGACFFEVRWDSDAGTYLGVSVNGEA